MPTPHRPEEPFRMPPMRPVDHVEVEVRPPRGFWYRTTGWKDWILSVLFGGLIVASAVIDPWHWTWWVQGTVILVLMLAANWALKRFVGR